MSASLTPDSPQAFVFITGGLGNQMFQLAAALDAAHGGPVELLPDLGAPRRNDGIHADIEGLQLPSAVRIGSVTNVAPLRIIASKAAGYLLRIGVIPARLEQRPWFRSLARLAAAVVIAPAIGHMTTVRAARGIGYDPVAQEPARKPLLIGYFQTWRHAYKPQVRRVFTEGLEFAHSPWYRDLQRVAAQEHPIVVHVRLGDYRKEPSLGLIAADYYRAGLQRLRQQHPESRLWLFSDEPEAALAMLPEHEQLAGPRLVDPPADAAHPLEVLRAMTLGCAYLLGNSTFGWWGATLSSSAQAPVIAPEPWFVLGPPVRDLIPEHWVRLRRDSGEEVPS